MSRPVPLLHPVALGDPIVEDEPPKPLVLKKVPGKDNAETPPATGDATATPPATTEAATTPVAPEGSAENVVEPAPATSTNMDISLEHEPTLDTKATLTRQVPHR